MPKIKALALALLSLALLAPSPAAAAKFPLAQYLKIRGAADGTFIENGRAMLFRMSVTGTPQLWRVPSGGGWPDQLTFFDDRVLFAEPAPNGEAMIFGKDTGGDERTQLYWMKSDGRDLTPITENPKVIHHFGGFSRDGYFIAYASNARNEAFFDVYVMDMRTKRSRMVLQHDGNNTPVAWSPDSQELVVSRDKSNVDNDLYLVDLRNGNSTLLTPHNTPTQYANVAWPPEGRKILIATDENREFMNLAALDVDSRKLSFLEDKPRDLEGLALSRDGRQLALAHNREGYSDLSYYELKKGDASSVRLGIGPKLPEGVISHLEWDPTGTRLTASLSGPTDPATIYVGERRENTMNAVTRPSTAGIPKSTFAAPQLTHYPSFDGKKIPAFLYLPQNYLKKLPCIVDVHGGPEAQERPSFSPLYQYFLSNGYAVMALNIRGSTGYGKTYTHLDDVRKRGDAIADVEYANRWLRSQGVADPDKIAIMGGSYGGYMVLSCLTRQPTLWAAGVDVVGISNFITFLANTGPWRRALRAAEYGDPEKDAEFLREYSPFFHAEKVQAPLMVIQGANDPRVPASEAEQMVKSIRSRGGTVEYMLFADEGHGLAKLPNRIKGYEGVVSFLDKHVKGR